MGCTHTEWKVAAVTVAGREFYQAYRLRIAEISDADVTRETRGGYYEHRADAERLAAILNEEERNR